MMEDEICDFIELSEKTELSKPGAETTIQTMSDRKYLPEIQKVYYELLASQVAANEAHDVIKAVIKCFIPSVDIQQLRLPQRTCAGYINRYDNII